MGDAASVNPYEAPRAPANGVASIATTVVFLMWTYRAAKNVRAFGQYGLAHSPAWAVGSWFVPIASLFVPYAALKEIWQASDPETVGTNDTSWVTRPVPAVFPLWWATYLLHSFINWSVAVVPIMSGHASVMKRLASRQAACAAKLHL